MLNSPNPCKTICSVSINSGINSAADRYVGIHALEHKGSVDCHSLYHKQVTIPLRPVVLLGYDYIMLEFYN